MTGSPSNLTRKEVLFRFRISVGWLHAALKDGRFPRPFYVGAKPLWRETDLQAVENGTWALIPEPKPEASPQAPAEPPKRVEIPAHLGGLSLIDKIRLGYV